MIKAINVALIGNPNTGKTSVFNKLTGLNQKVGNYPGITVEKKEGYCTLDRMTKAHLIDLPGTYSVNASSIDESIVLKLLMNKNNRDYPDVAVVISDVENLKRNLLLFTQVKDLNIPAILAINMSDRMIRKGIKIDIDLLEKKLDTKVALISVRENKGFETLKELLINYRRLSKSNFLDLKNLDKEYFKNLQKVFPNEQLYKLWLVITQDTNFGDIDRNEIKNFNSFSIYSDQIIKRLQQRETIKRYQIINSILKSTYSVNINNATDLRSRIDRVLIHKFWGYVIFFFLLLLIFQSIYDWSSYPMDFIDSTFASLSDSVKQNFPPGLFTNLISEGIINGIGGIVIFIPQISFLFLFISILEESGYMSRVVFLMDRGLRKFGLSGKSVIPLISGTACAIPAVMATRNIENWKERLITILVTPFTTCAARLPVYLIIIALVIPDQRWMGMNIQGITLMGLYLLGFLTALVSSSILTKVLKINHKTYFVVELPDYKMPLLGNVFINVLEKVKAFVFEAGKIILSISIILWGLASFGPGENFKNAEEIVKSNPRSSEWSSEALDYQIRSYKLEHSYIGIMGKSITPIISPLGYDWKIGIALITSFAAREVFVGTLATIYSVGQENEMTIKEKMKSELKSNGQPMFDLPTGISLLLFYAFAMQCMSTLAIVRRETNSWKWPLLQLVSMTLIAYLAALTAYQTLS